MANRWCCSTARSLLLAGREEGKPDATDEVCTQFGATQDRPMFSRAALGAGFVKRLASADRPVKAIETQDAPDAKSAFPSMTEGSILANPGRDVTMNRPRVIVKG